MNMLMLNKNKSKKGVYTSRDAGIILFIFAALIFVYIIAIPPSDRIELLQGNQSHADDVEEDQDEFNKTLLDIEIGKLEALNSEQIKHPIPNARIFVDTQTSLLLEKDSLLLKENLFSRIQENYVFNLLDEDKVKDFILSFEIERTNAPLNIDLNGFDLIDDVLDEGYHKKTFNAKNLKAGENKLSFSIKPIDWSLFSNHYLELKNLKLLLNKIDHSSSKYYTLVNIPAKERDHLKLSTLRFYLDCVKTDLLEVTFNEKLIFSSYPSCQGTNEIEIPNQYFLPGDNILRMKTNGDVYLSDAFVINDLNLTDIQPYYFEMSKEEYETSQDDSIFVQLEFYPTIEKKEADVYINGIRRHLRTNENVWEREITNYVKKGSNYVHLDPDTDMNVINLKVYIP